MKAILKGINRPQGVYIAGIPGYGKSSLIQQMALADIKAGRGVCVIDPTSDLVSRLIHWIPHNRVSDTIYFDTDNPTSIDFFSYRNPAERQVLTDQLLSIFDLDNAPVSRPRLQRIIGTLFDANENSAMRRPENADDICTFLDIQSFIERKTRRDKILSYAPNRKEQWPDDRFKKLSDFDPIIERMTPFTESPTLKMMLGAKRPVINIWDVMQSRKVLLVNLKDTPTDLFIGSLIVSKLQQATFGRRWISESQRIPYYLYIDECHTVMKYAAADFEKILTRARKYKLCLVMANQTPQDLPGEIRQKMGTVGAIILFNLDPEDSRIFKNRMLPNFSTDALYDLQKFVALCRINGEVSLVKTPLFLGPSSASYAKHIQKRTGDNASSNSGTNPHNEGDDDQDPEPSGLPTFRLTKAKRESLELLAEYFCLRTNDVAQLLRGRDPNENDKRSVRHTLGLLHKAGLVSRLPYYDLGRDRGGETYVYGLSDKGVKSVESLFAHAKTFDEHSQRTLNHELEISWFHMALKSFCLKNNLTLYWQQSDIKRTVAPDALFAITDPTKPDGKNTLYYFLEIERAKIGHYVNGEPSIMRKLAKYYEYYGSDTCAKEWGAFRQYRVIVVQQNHVRSKNLLQELNAKLNHRMFWLTTEQSYKQDMGGKIFQTPKDWDKAGYSFLDI